MRTHFQLYACVYMCKHPHKHSLSHACNGIQNFLHAYAFVSVVSAAVVVVRMHTRSALRDRALQKQLDVFFFRPTATIMATKK